MGEYKIDRQDFRFILFEEIGLENIRKMPAFAESTEEDFTLIIEEAYKIAKDVLFPVNAAGDKKGCRYEKGQVYLPEEFVAAYKPFKEAGWVSPTHNLEYGGQGLPETVGALLGEIFMGSNVSFALTNMLTRGASHLIESFGNEALKSTYCEKMYSGQWAGTMCLTEPQAGSDVGATKASAKKGAEDDYYRVTGTKSFISSGEHNLTENIIHLVLARVEGDAPGTKGLSLFVIPKFFPNPDGSLGDPNDVFCSGIEHKMGIKGSPTCTLNFGDNGKCIGWMLGKQGGGMTMMFQMMNEARYEVGVQGHSAAAVCYLLALQYARERYQGERATKSKEGIPERALIIEHPDIKRNLLWIKAVSDGMRALLVETGYHMDMAHQAEKEVDRAKYQGYVELLTPICKAYCSDTGFKATELAVQIYGGYGYCSEYEAEQYCRDAKIASIYEGTNGIQALDLVFRKVLRNNAEIFNLYISEMTQMIEKAEDEGVKDIVSELARAREELVKITQLLLLSAKNKDFAYATLSATPYLKMFGHVCLQYYLTKQALIASRRLKELSSQSSGENTGCSSLIQFYKEKLQTVRFFTYHILPETYAIGQEIASKDRSPLEVEFREI